MNKNIFTILFVACSIFSAAAVAPFAHAQLVVVDPSDVTQNTLTAVATGTSATAATTTATVTTANKVQSAVEQALTVVAYNLANVLSKKLVSLAINEINGGASGIDHPQQFITSYTQLFANSAAQAVTTYTGALIANTQNPFAQQIGVNQANNYSNNQTALNQFSLNNYSNNNWQASSNNLGNSGIYGWDYYVQAGLPQNNPTGSQMIANQELAANVASAQSIQKTQITSSGYQPKQTPCNTNGPVTAAQTAAITTAQAKLADDQTGLQGAMDTIDAINNGAAPTPAQLQDVTSFEADIAADQQALQTAQNAANSANVEYGTSCASQVITNPVGAVDTLAAQTITAPFKNIATNATNAKWYTLLSSTLVNFAQGLINAGISHLKLNLQNTTSLNVGPSAGSSSCGVASGVVSITPPTANLCVPGAMATSATNNGAGGWSWLCLNSATGVSSTCSAVQ